MSDSDSDIKIEHTPFFNAYMDLCVRDEISPTAAALRAGMSNAAPNKWANGAIPSYKTQLTLANSFNVTVDQLMGRVPLSNTPSEESQGLSSEPVFIYKHANSSDDEIKEKPTSEGELDAKKDILSLLDGMTEAELMLVRERIKKIRDSR